VRRLLIDTHVFLWSTSAPDRLSANARAAIEDSDNEVYVSAAVGWEMSIKYAVGKLGLPMSPELYLPSRMVAHSFKALGISMEHALVVSSLPAYHADPFDRIMIAQAQFEGMTFVTRDMHALTYPVRTIEA
jgi:PIN domain nuclease of toxin-antitoxin system